MANIEEKVENLVKPIIEKIGYQLYDVEYAKEGKNFYLRIFIDKDAGVDLKDCEKVNDAISDTLDEADYIKEQYFLEVSSPGVERVLRKDWHLKQSIGNNVNVKLFKKDENGNKEYQGELFEFDDEYVTLRCEQDTNKKENASNNISNHKKNVNINNGSIQDKNIDGVQNESEQKKNIDDSQKVKILRKNISQIKTIYDWD